MSETTAAEEATPDATPEPKEVEPTSGRPSAPKAKQPQRAAQAERSSLRADIRELSGTRLFWAGFGIKFVCALMFGSHFITRWFGPFVAEFVRAGGDPWETFLARGEHQAFPYGPAMLLGLSAGWLPGRILGLDPTSHLGLLFLRLPLLAADFTICVLLKRWLKLRARDIVITYWLSPIVIYATYVHGQLDLLPTALLCLALYLVFDRKITQGAIVFGIALATKGHLVIALPFAIVFLLRQRALKGAWLKFTAVVMLTAGALYVVPLSSNAFRVMVLGGQEAKKLWSVGIPYGVGLSLYLAPAALALAFLRFLSYRKVNRELTIMFLGVLYIGLVALVPPQPGWFIWSLPFVAYFGAQFSRTGRYALILLNGAYVLYFFVSDPVVFLEALDPTFGVGTGEGLSASLTSSLPGIFSRHGTNIVWTTLFAATALAASEMYRKGVRSNALYSFRDESFMMGIGGDSGAGKHTLANDLKALLGESMSVVNGDDDHRWERGHAMWRRYTHLDPRGNYLGEQAEHLAALRRGGDVQKPHYDHDKGKFTPPVQLKHTDFIAIVGLHPFYLASQRQVLHLKIFVDPLEDVRRKWKVARDVSKRGYTPEKVLAEMDRRASDSVKYVQPQKRYADVVISQNAAESADPNGVNLGFQLSNHLEPLGLFDALVQVEGLEVEWLPDEMLERDQFVVKGTIDAAQLEVIARASIPYVDELAHVPSAWHPGGRGLAQLVALYAMSARLRLAPSTELSA